MMIKDNINIVGSQSGLSQLVEQQNQLEIQQNHIKRQMDQLNLQQNNQNYSRYQGSSSSSGIVGRPVLNNCTYMLINFLFVK